MNLKDFESNINSTILERGHDYFVNECVDSLEKVAPGLWYSEVHGSETYSVEVQTHRTKIKGWDCDCPYDHGPICKHVVAVFYAISEHLELEKDQPDRKTAKNRSTKTDKVKVILNSVSKEQLQQFLVGQFKRDRSLKNLLIAHFADLLGDEPGEKYRTIVRNLYKAVQGPYGFIDYRDSRTLTDPLFDLVQKAEQLLAKNDIAGSMLICQTLIEEVPVFIHNMDDSNGEAGGVMDGAFNIFHRACEQAPPMMKDDLFIYCVAEYPKEKYHDLDFEDRFLDVLPLLITTAEQEAKFFDLIDGQIEAEKDKSCSDYSIVQLLKSKIDYLQRTKREKEVLTLIEANKKYPDFREVLVSQAISEKDFNAAKELCQKGIAIAKTERHWGTENTWHIKLLEIAEKQKDTSEIRELCEKLYFNKHYSMDYYLKLRYTYAKNEWPDRCEEIINKLKGKNQRGGYDEVNALADIFIEEKYIDRLLKLLQINSKDVFFVDTYADHLKNQFPIEILALYEEGVKEFAQSTGRSIYNDVAKLLKKMKKIKGGKENVKMTIRHFRNLYKNRRAMMEVLNNNFPDTIPSPKGKEVQKTINANLRLF